MHRPLLRLVLALTAAGACSVLSAPAALAGTDTIDWHTCANTIDFACAHLSVPADPGGFVPGTISLAIRRRRAPLGDGSTAVIALAGGPGQAALPFAEQTLTTLGPALYTRDLIVFDQRGTGDSGALRCPALDDSPFTDNPAASLVAKCAEQIGATSNLYETADSVADIEAVRVAAGYDKLVLYGTSYGTKVALDYARAYPNNVQSLVLDSTVPPDGPDVWGRSTFAAIPRILQEICAGRLCHGVTANPVVDLDKLAHRLAKGPIHGRVIDGQGRAHRVAVSQMDLVDILVAGDLDPTLRSDFPSAVRSALKGDNAPLARLRERALGSPGGESDGIDDALNIATTCEDELFPWDRSATPAVRLTQAKAALAALGTAPFAPFDSHTVFEESPAVNCYAWPYDGTAPPPSGGPLPNVPTLIFSGTDDLRTPTQDAVSVAAQIPDAWLVEVGDTGHAVLESEFGTCAAGAVKAFFNGGKQPLCRSQTLPSILDPTPVAPLSVAGLPPAGGLAGAAGHTLRAVEKTVAYLVTELNLETLSALENGESATTLSFGGLRNGWAKLNATAVALHGFSYIPGMEISGKLGAPGDQIEVGGPDALAGSLRQVKDGALEGTVGGRSVRLPMGSL